MVVDVSVVIPTYNRDSLLKRSIDSILEQTVQPAHIIVIDDASKFNTEAYLSQQYTLDRLTVIHHEENQGAAAARNTGLKNTETRYVAFLDSDDYWHPQKLEAQLSVVKSDPDVELVYCDQWIVDEEGSKRPSGKTLISQDIWNALMTGWTPPNPSTLFFDTDVLRKLGGFDGQFSSCSDHDLWMRVALQEVNVEYIPDELSYFTRDADNRTSFNFEARINGVHEFLAKWREHIVDDRGEAHYRRFKWNYEVEVALPIFKARLLDGKWKKCFQMYAEALATNPVFYIAMVKQVWRHRPRP